MRIPTCRFRATVGVPDRPAYAVEIAGYEPFRVTRPDLEQSDWVVYLPALPPEA